MLSSNAVIIDLSNLNVLFRYDGKFCTALNYGEALDRLGSVLSGFGPGYDIYLCLKPRMVGEGDCVIPELSMSAVPFVADSEELTTVLKYFRSCQGVNEVLLCNWLNNYVEKARTDTFDSAFYYGTRVAKVSVDNRLVTDFQIFGSLKEFTDTYGDEFDGYGDVGLLDIDGFKAQFPEFVGATKTNAVALAPLAHCCSTQCRVNADQVLEMLGKRASESKRPEPKDTPEVEEKPSKKPVQKSRALENYVPSPEPKSVRRKGRTPILAGLFCVVSILLSIGLGFSYSYTRSGAVVDNPDSYYAEVDSKVAGLQQIAEVYRGTGTAMFNTVSAYDYVGKSGLQVFVVGFERYPDYYVVRCDCASEDVFNAFVEYLNQTYLVGTTNDLGVSGTEEAPLHQYSVMFT